MKNQFIVGKKYQTRSIGDSNCFINIKVERRTNKSLWAKDPLGLDVRRFVIGTCMDDGIQTEFIYPWGSGYSMAPSLKANQEVTS